LAVTEQDVEDLRVLTSLQMDRVVTETEINAIGQSFGIPPVDGKPAQHRQTFYTSTRPAADISVERGTLVGTADGSRIYTVMERITLVAANADAYYVSSRRRYEITARVEAVSIGEDGNLPAFRINRFFTPAGSFDGTENRETSTGGTDKQSFSAYLERIRRRFLGQSPETGGGIATKILEAAPEVITDISLVYPKDREIFRRDTGRPAIDAYLIGEELESAQQRYIAVGGETSIELELTPVVSVDLVQLDSVTTDGFALQVDANPGVTGTARATDVLVLVDPLTPGQVVDISYQYDKLVRDIQVDSFDSQDRQFGTDILIRRPVQVPVSCTLDITVLPSFDVNRTTDSVSTVLYDYVEKEVFADSLLPEMLIQNIIDNVSGVSSIKLLKFTATTRSLVPVESISLRKNEVARVDQDNLIIRTHQ
jgi:hypothetical protein